MTPYVWRILCLRNSSSVPYFRQPPNLTTAARRNRKCTECGTTAFGRNRMSAESAHLSTFSAETETETEAEIRSTSSLNHCLLSTPLIHAVHTSKERPHAQKTTGQLAPGFVYRRTISGWWLAPPQTSPRGETLSHTSAPSAPRPPQSPTPRLLNPDAANVDRRQMFYIHLKLSRDISSQNLTTLLSQGLSTLSLMKLHLQLSQ